METRALAIAFFFAVGTALGGITGPLLFGKLIASGDETQVAIGFFIGAALMAVGGITEIFFGVKAEGQKLEDIAEPLTAGGRRRRRRARARADEPARARRERDERIRGRSTATLERERAGRRRYRPGPGSGSGYSPGMGMLGTTYRSREDTGTARDTEIDAIARALRRGRRDDPPGARAARERAALGPGPLPRRPGRRAGRGQRPARRAATASGRPAELVWAHGLNGSSTATTSSAAAPTAGGATAPRPSGGWWSAWSASRRRVTCR